MGWCRLKNLFFWFIIHITHWALYIGNCLALLYIVAYEPWYIALPLITTIGNPLIGGIHCAYNNIENTYRLALGWRMIEQNFLNAIVADINYLIYSRKNK